MKKIGIILGALGMLVSALAAGILKESFFHSFYAAILVTFFLLVFVFFLCMEGEIE
jgi:hypothetical protein